MFNLEDYTTVKERIDLFWSMHPMGRILTYVTKETPEYIICRTELYRDDIDQRPFSTGHAKEVISERGVNRDFALENCETSSVGIACKNAKIGTEKNAISREEAAKVNRVKQQNGNFERVKPTGGIKQEDAWTIKVENPADELEVKDSKMPEPGLNEMLVNELGAEEVHTCQHGQMQVMNGIGKTDKPYFGYVCRATPRSAQCPAIWYTLSPSGKWVKPKSGN